MLACQCLNVIIETGEDEDVPHKVTVDLLGLTREEAEDSFFKQSIQQVGKLININKSHAGLIETRNVGAWAVHYCINCDVHSHAVHREKGASCVLVNAHLLTNQAIAKLKTSHKFSKLYNILINIDEDVQEDLLANSYLPNDVENVIKSFRQIAADSLKNEAAAVEERIKQFTQQQYSELSDLRERAFREQQILTKIILSNTSVDNNSTPTSTNLAMSNPQGIPSRLNEPLAAGSVNIASSPNSTIISGKFTPKRQKSCPSGHTNSFDAEGLFEFDGADEIQAAEDSEATEGSDNEEGMKDESGVTIPKNQRIVNNTIAKSLPMSIPSFLTQHKNIRNFEEEEDPKPVDSNLDIAASMKAIAKSLHGDTVFGDLPKPRYNLI